MKNSKNQKGITLIALVITIIVLIILVAVSITMLTGNSGIITNANNAKTSNLKGQEEEAKGMLLSQWKIYKESKEENPPTVEGFLKKYYSFDGNTSSGTVKVNGVDIKVSKDENGDLKPEGSSSEDNSQGGTQTATLPSTTETTPYLPDNTFTQVAGTNLDNGLVIADTQGNEWVWVEVPKSVTASATSVTDITAALKTYAESYIEDINYDTDEWHDGWGLTETEYNELYSRMINSIKANGGFWIGRYEVGDEDATVTKIGRTSSTGATNKPVIKQNQIPYNHVSYSQAHKLSKKFSEGKTEYKTSLMFGIQWDLTCKFLEVKATNLGTSVESIQAAISSNSKDWGNYRDATFDITRGMYSEDYGESWNEVSEIYTKELEEKVLLTTGATDRNCLMNIYDFAGNEWEWTIEYDGNLYRGGYYAWYGNYKASLRYNGYPSIYEWEEDSLGFRPSLYK